MPRTPLSNLSNMEIPISSPRPKYDMAHMKNFLESVKTPAELRQLDSVLDDVLDDVQDENPNDDEKNANNVEVAEEAISLEANRIEFGNIGFISLGEGTADDNDNEVLADDKEHEEAAVDETHDSCIYSIGYKPKEREESHSNFIN